MTALRQILIIFFILISLRLFSSPNKCLNCHKGIENIREPNSGMMKAIDDLAGKAGFGGNNCIVCHGGNPKATDIHAAHRGSVPFFLQNAGPKNFYPDPGSSWINENTCGHCHQEQMNSLMMTEQGKIQGTLWTNPT